MTDASLFELDGIGHRYGGTPVLDGVSFRLAPGDKAVLLGANGTGKSTLLKIMNGLLAPAAGTCRYRGEAIGPAPLRDKARNRRFRSEVALLFQNPDAMLFNPTVFDEIAFGPRQLGLPDVEARVLRWAEAVGVTAHLRRPPFGLSGGEKQKVCLAALLAIEPAVLLLDEPTAALDPRGTGWLVDFLADLPVTLLTSTHNLSLAPELGPRALVLGEDHTLAYDGPVREFTHDLHRLVAANLVHSHRHRHGGVEHRHFHVHDWE